MKIPNEVITKINKQCKFVIEDAETAQLLVEPLLLTINDSLKGMDKCKSMDDVRSRVAVINRIVTDELNQIAADTFYVETPVPTFGFDMSEFFEKGIAAPIRIFIHAKVKTGIWVSKMENIKK